MKSRRLIAILSALLLGTALFAQNNAELAKVVGDMQNDPDLRHASLAVSVYNITRNSNVYSYEAQRSLLPASLAKLFTTAVGFDRLGSKFRFKTTIGYSGEIDKNGTLHGNIYITGGGDPLLGSYRYKQTQPDTLFHTWYKAIVGQGIKAIDGRICFDATIFDNQMLHDSWQWGDVGNYYGAGVSGLNFHENMYFVYFDAGKKLGYPASIDHTSPKNLSVRHQNEVVTGSENSGDNVVIYGDPFSPRRLCRGTVPLGKTNFPVRGSMPNAAETCAELFAVYLRNHSVNVSSNVSEIFAKHDNVKTILDYYSNTYYVVAQYTNLTSNNMYADCIFKYLGYDRYGKGSYANGAKAMKDFFREHGIESSGVSLVDGSGLSRDDKVTADFTCRFLAEVSHMPIYDDFQHSLGKVGESGTVKNMLPNLPSNIQVRMKSGTMEGVKSYAGYITTAKGELLCFSVICNNYICSGNQMKQKLEKIIYKIATME